LFKPSRRALVIAASFALGLSTVGPAAHAGLLGGGDSDTAVEGVGLPVGGELLGDEGLLGGILGGEGILGGVLGGQGLLGGGPLGLVGSVLGGDEGPLGIVGGVLGGEDSALAGGGLADVVGVLPVGVVPGGESVLGVLDGFSESGSIVPGLEVLDELGILGILGSL
jgi:hypothetical protein